MLLSIIRASIRAVVLCLCLVARGAAQGPLPEPALQLHPGDGMRIQIRDEPALGGEFQVDADGFALLPILGRVQVADRPFTALRDALYVAYGGELRDPMVQIIPLLRVAVLGEVRQPGLFSVDPTHTLADVLALAGGMTPNANRRRISLLRQGGTGIAQLDANSQELRVPLRSGDQILIESRGWFRENSSVLLSAATSVAAAAITSLLIR